MRRREADPDQGCGGGGGGGGARGIYYPRGPFAAELQHQWVQEKPWEQKDKLSRGERRYMMAVLTEQLFLLIIIFDHNFFAMIILY